MHIIISTRIVDPGFFTPKYVVYLITTTGIDYTVERRYSDFVSLRQEMMKDFPGSIIPPIPGKKIGGNSDPEFIKERKFDLQIFIINALKHPLLNNYKLLKTFLTAQSKDWEDTVKSFSKTTVLKEVEEYETIEGTAKILYSDRTKEYCEKLNSTTKEIKEAFKDLTSYNQALSYELRRLSQSMEGIGKLYQKIGSLYKSLEDKTNAELFLSMAEGYFKLNNTYTNFKKEYRAQFSIFFNYFANEIGSLEELLQKRKSTDRKSVV